jgi:AcrR family transcriptional regulator
VSRAVNSDQRRRDIALAVYRVVAKDGIEAASMRRIAAEAGCTTGSLTHHFADHRDLLEYAVGMAVDESMARLLDTSRSHGLREALAQFLPLDEHRRQENAVWLVGAAAAARDPELAANLSRRWAAANELLAAELRRRLGAAGREVDDDDVDMLVDEVLSAVDGIALYAQADPDRYPPERQLELVDRVLRRTGLA